MKRMTDILFLIVLWLTATAWPSLASEPAWRARADFDVTSPGLVEVVLPPGLVDAGGDGTHDLVLTGPDHQPRAFELFWRDPVDRVRRRLNPGVVQLTNQHGFVWEAETDEEMVADQIEVQLAADQYMGRLDVEGYTPAGWATLAHQAAIFDSGGHRRARIPIPPDCYRKLRLSLAGSDRSGRKSVVPILSVDLLGRIPGRDYAEQCISVQAASSAMPDGLELELFPPGAGMQIQSIVLLTQAGFQGRWEIGRYVIVDGRKAFQPDVRGQVNHVSEDGRRLILHPDRQWLDRSMVVRLYHGRNYIGRVEEVQVCVRLPRLIFLADSTGTHVLTTGLGAAHQVYPLSRIPGRMINPPPKVRNIETNPAWRLDSLAGKYQLRGAPFDPAGYTWKSTLNIPGPGYYRLQLIAEAALDPDFKGMRLVHGQSQVPFFMGREEIRRLTLKAEPRQDRKNNRTIWELQLLRVSSRWHAIELESEGIFNRRVELLAPKAASSGWQSLAGKTWEHRTRGRAVLLLPLPQTGQNRDRLRLVIAHGDNQPIAITHIRAHYGAPPLFFLAHEGGTYELFGGNPEASAARYDLSLIQDELKASMPEPIGMTALASISAQGWHGSWHSLLQNTRWGFYAALALATVILIVIVARLFPKPSCEDDQDC